MPTLTEVGKVDLSNVPKRDQNRVSQMVAKDYIVERILARFEKHKLSPMIKGWADRVMILVAGTGSGKSVTIPPEAYLALRQSYNKNVVVTQPRVISAVRTVQEDVIKIYPLTLGVDVGYQTGSLTRKPVRGLIYVQIKVLLQQLKVLTDDQLIKKYSCIIIDEAHERSSDTDLIIYLLKRFLIRNYTDPNCPIVIFMSATIELERFSKYFTDENETSPEVISVVGRTFPITRHYLDADSGNYIWKTLELVKEIHTRDHTPNSDILIFVAGNPQITLLSKMLEEANAEFDKKFIVIGLNSEIYNYGIAEMRILESGLDALLVDDKHPIRKVVIATNVAETSVTIASLRYVIDTGLRNTVEFNPVGFSMFITVPVSRDMAMQRMGRVGRIQPGDAYMVYTEATLAAMQAAKLPDITSTDISEVVLALAVFNGSLAYENLDMMDRPSELLLWYAIDKLYTIGLLTFAPETFDLRPADESTKTAAEIKADESRRKDVVKIVPTITGVLIDKFRKIQIESARMILAGYEHGANILDLISIAAMSVHNVRKKGYELRRIADSPEKTEHLINDSFIDCIFLLEEFAEVAKSGIAEARAWCEENCVSYDEMLFTIDERDDLIADIVGYVGFDPLYNGLGADPSEYSLRKLIRTMPDIAIGEITAIKKSIYDGYRFNMAVLTNKEYVSMHSRTPVARPPAMLGQPRFFIYNNITFKMGSFNPGHFSVMDGYVTIDPELY